MSSAFDIEQGFTEDGQAQTATTFKPTRNPAYMSGEPVSVSSKNGMFMTCYSLARGLLIDRQNYGKKILVIVAMLFIVLLTSFGIASYGLAWLVGW